MTHIIRFVNTATDVVAITNIYNWYISHTTVSFETEPLSIQQMKERIEVIASRWPYYVCEINGKVVGYAYAHQWKERAAYNKTLETTIYLDNTHTHKGIGHNLMEHLIVDCSKRGYRVLIACITGENTNSIAFHKALGFNEASHFHNVGNKFGRTLDVIDMEYQL